MKFMMILILILGILTAGISLFEQVRTMAISATIVSGIADLRQENNMDKCQIVENQTNRLLRNIRDSFVPIMWMGVATAVAGLAGIVTISRKRKMTEANHPLAEVTPIVSQNKGQSSWKRPALRLSTKGISLSATILAERDHESVS